MESGALPAVLAAVASIVVAGRCGTAPEIPVHALGQRAALRAKVIRIAAVGVAVDLRHVADQALLHGVHAHLHRGRGMPVVSDLRDDARLLRLAFEQADLLHRERKRLFEEEIDAAPHGHQRRERVMMIRGRDEDRVQFIPALCVHLAIVGEATGLREVELSVEADCRLLHGRETIRIRVAHGDHLEVLGTAHSADEPRHLRAAADQAHADLRAGGNLPRAALSKGHATNAKGRTRGQEASS